jgi:hypothetical protein
MKEAAYFCAERNEIVLFKLFEVNGSRSEELKIRVYAFYLHVTHSLLKFNKLKQKLIGEAKLFAFEIGLSGTVGQIELSEMKCMKQMKIF